MATKKQLTDALDAAGIEYDPKAKVAELEQLADGAGVTTDGDTVAMVGPNGGNPHQVPAGRVKHLEGLGHTRA